MWCDDTSKNFNVCHSSDNATFFDWVDGRITGIAGRELVVGSSKTSEGGNGEATATSSATAPLGAPSSSCLSTEPSSRNNVVDRVAIGLGVGLPLLLIASITAILFVLEKRKRRRDDDELKELRILVANKQVVSTN